MKILNSLRKFFNSSLVLCLLSMILISCDSDVDLTSDLEDDFTAKYTFYSFSPEENNGYSSVTLSYPIGKTLFASDLPDSNMEGFERMNPGYEIKGWVFYRNPRTSSKELPANIKTENGGISGIVKEITVSSDSASFYVQNWNPITYNIVFDSNGGSFPGEKSLSESYSFEYDVEKALPTAKELGISKKGYSFSGWGMSKNQAAASPSYADGELIPNAASGIPNLSYEKGSTVTLYALWLRNDINITFDANGGTGSMESIEINFDKLPESLPQNTFTKEGHNFIGWCTKSDGSDYLYSDMESITKANYPSMTSESVTLYAQWGIISYIVDFDSAGGSSVSSEFIAWNEKASKPESPSRTGYDFAGWYTSSDDGTTLSKNVYDFESPVKESFVLYAKWSVQTFTVKYSANADDATGNMSAQIIKFSDLPVNLTANSFKREGYVFSRWNTSEDGSGKNYYLDGSEIAEYNWFSGDVTLYAQWDILTYNVNFDSAGGTWVESQYIVHHETASEPSEPSRTGYDFEGWYTSSDDGITLIDKFDFSTAITGDLTLYAKWKVQYLTIHFDSNGSEESVEAINASFEQIPITLPLVSREGYYFTGWSESASSEIAEYFAGYIINEENWQSGTLNLYAVWEIIKFSVDFVWNENGEILESQFIEYGKTVTQPTAPSRTGYIFAGWYDPFNGSGDEEFDFSTKVYTNYYLHAKWLPEKLTLTFHANGGVNSMDEQVLLYKDLPVALDSNQFTQEGYDFVSWNTSSDGGGMNFADSELISEENWQSGELDLYAQWEIQKFTVRFINRVDGNSEIESQEIEWQNCAAQPEDPIEGHYNFLGWDSEYSDKNTVISAFDFSTPITSDMEIYAKWEPKKYTVTFDGNGATTGSMESMEFTYGDEQVLPKNAFTKTGNLFAGWSTSSLANYVTYHDESEISVSSDMTLYARWTQRASTFGESKLQCNIDDENEQIIFEAFGSYDVYEWSVDNVRVTTSGNILIIPYDGEYALNKNHFVLLLGGNSDETWTAESANFRILPGNN